MPDPTPPQKPPTLREVTAHELRDVFQVDEGAHEPLADLAAAAGHRLEESLHAQERPRRRGLAYVFLAVAIVAGVTGTSALSATEGFTQPWPVAVVALAYFTCFLALTQALKVIPISVAYAIWSGAGIALITLIGWRLFGQSLDLAEVSGIAMIIAGVVVIHLFSNSRVH